MKANLYTSSGKLVKEVTLPGELFNVSVKPELLAQAIHIYRSNEHQGLSQVQTRGDVDRTTAKWFRQKGTGRARHGARSAPLFVGGGRAHGPHGLKAADLKLNQKMRQLALLSALSQLAKDGQISLVENLAKLPAKTKSLSDLVTNLKLGNKVTLVTAGKQDNLVTAAKNLSAVSLASYHTLNAYLLLNTRHLLLEETTLPLLSKWLVKTPKKPAVKKTTKTLKIEN